jgi:glycosyltransferase involved in cell wall biosynthesis
MRRLPLTHFRRILLRQADVCVTITKEIEVELAEFGLGAIPFRRIPNAVDLTVFRPAAAGECQMLRARLGLPQDRVVCVFIGRLVPQKDPGLLLEAWSKVNRPDAHLVLVGDGPLRPHLEARIAAGLCAGRVTLAGATADTASYLRAADLLALPSRAEGMSNVVLEAMASGIPVVATNVGGANEILDNGQAGLLVPPGDVTRLAEGLDGLLGDNGLRLQLGKRVRELAQRYSQDRVANEYVTLYERLLAGGSVKPRETGLA